MPLEDWYVAQINLIHFSSIDIGDEFFRNAQILAADLDRFALSIRSFREPLTKAVREVVIPSMRLNFDAEGRPPWAPLAKRTVRKRKSAHPILQDTGRLRRVALQKNIWSIDRNSAAITGLSERVRYAKFHQTGTFIMPQRQFAVLQSRDLDEIERVFYTWLVERSIRMGRFPA